MDESLADEVERSRFTTVRLREGYDMAEVDRLLEELSARLRSGAPVGELVATARFTPVRGRQGYAMEEVDDLLERVVRSIDGGTADAATPARNPSGPITELRSPLARLFSRLRGR